MNVPVLNNNYRYLFLSRVVKEQAGLKPKKWVRIKCGVFKDDLAQVDYVDMASNQVGIFATGTGT
jgi:transcription antitermination factor NusG